MQQIFRDIIS